MRTGAPKKLKVLSEMTLTKLYDPPKHMEIFIDVTVHYPYYLFPLNKQSYIVQRLSQVKMVLEPEE